MMSENKDKNDILEQILDMTLDEVKDNQHLLEYDVEPYLRKSSSQKSSHNPNQELIDDQLVEELERDAYSSQRKTSTLIPIPEVDTSGRSRYHFDSNAGRIFAFNFAYELRDEDLHSLFGVFGSLKRAAVNYNKNGQSLGSALIVYENRADAKNAFLALDGHRLDGRKLLLRMLDTNHIRHCEPSILKKNKGDQIPIDDNTLFDDKEKITVDDINDLKLDEYIQRRKRAKTWNYY